MTIRDFFIACPSITGEHIDVRVRVTECLVQWKFYFEAWGEKKKFVDERALEKAKHHTLEQAEWGAIMRSYCLGLFPEHEALLVPAHAVPVLDGQLQVAHSLEGGAVVRCEDAAPAHGRHDQSRHSVAKNCDT